MKERPILFSASMVLSLIDGSKTQTRRVAKLTCAAHVKEPGKHRRWHPADPEARLACPYGQPGDRLWVREAFTYRDGLGRQAQDQRTIMYYAGQDWKYTDTKWKPSIHMPRWASRILLEIVSVRVERLQDISESDAAAEGVEPLDFDRDGRTDRDFKLCPKCGGTGLYTAYGSNYGALPDTDCMECDTHVKRYQHLWNSINGHGSWDLNPWVWVVEFKRVTPC